MKLITPLNLIALIFTVLPILTSASAPNDDSTAVAHESPFKAAPVEGPFSQLEQYCQNLTDKDPICLLTPAEITVQLGDEQTAYLSQQGPFVAAMIVGEISGPYGSYDLAIQTFNGWYIQRLDINTNYAVSGGWTSSANIKTFEYDELPDNNVVIKLMVNQSGNTGGAIPASEYYQATTTTEIVCSVMTTGEPKCLGKVVTKVAR